MAHRIITFARNEATQIGVQLLKQKLENSPIISSSQPLAKMEPTTTLADALLDDLNDLMDSDEDEY